MRPVIQQDRTGCAIACVAALTERRYSAVKTAAARLGIEITQRELWSDPRLMRRLLKYFRVKAGATEERFTSWADLPSCALLAIKWHREKRGPAWHWVVYVRDGSTCCVLDSKRALRNHRRTDFGRMKPKWFIRVTPRDATPRRRAAWTQS
jgi:hypothetical protein